MKKINTPLTEDVIAELSAGEEILLSGEIYTARDQAHKRLCQMIEQEQTLPVDLSESVFYYCGPTAAPKGKIIGSCGPTTSKRMDEFVPLLMANGQRVMIGKGRREERVREAIVEYCGVYFVAPSGCGALLAECVIKNEPVAFADLGPEAIRKLTVENMPLIVAIDSKGKSIY